VAFLQNTFGIGGGTPPAGVAHYDVGDYDDVPAGFTDQAGNAAINVAVMVAVAAIFLTVLKRSGFRAMVAVGRG
jgi:hypothetical protein